MATGVKDFETYVLGQVHDVGGTPANTTAGATQLLRKRRHGIRVPSDGNATVANTYNLADFGVPGTVTLFTVVPEAALTASDTNCKTFSLQWVNGLGGAATVIGTFSTQTSGSGGSGNWAASTRITGTLSATIANRSFPSGAVVQFVNTASGSGVTLPAMSVFFEHSED